MSPAGGPYDDDRALALFLGLFRPNPLRHGILRSIDPETGRKDVYTTSQGVSRGMAREHLERLSVEGRAGWQPGNEEGTDSGLIDVDLKAYGPAFEAVVRDLKQALSLAAVPWYEEISTSGGSHVWVFTDEVLAYNEMHAFLRSFCEEAGHPELEVFPSSATAGVRGKWVLMPYSGALADEARLGVTWLSDKHGEPIPVDMLSEVVRVSADTVRLYAGQYLTEARERAQAGEAAAAGVEDLDPEKAWAELSRAVLAVPKAGSWHRHDAIIAFLNLAGRARRVSDMVELLRSEEVWRAWTQEDGSRTLAMWQAEVDRWYERWQADQGRTMARRGIAFLLEQGWQLGALKRTSNALMESGLALDKLPEAELAEHSAELLTRHGKLWAYDRSVAQAFRYDGKTWVAADDHMERVKADLEAIFRRYGKQLRESKLHNVYRKLERSYLTRDLLAEARAQQDYIAVDNGLLHWRSGELVPHDPDVVTIGRVNAEWDPDADPGEGAWHRFLAKAVGEQENGEKYLDLLQEFWGYGLVRGAYNRAFLNLSGPSSTGKSTAWKVATAVMGTTNGAGAGLAFVTDQGLFLAQDWTAHLVTPQMVVLDEVNNYGQGQRDFITTLKTLSQGGDFVLNPKGVASRSVTVQTKVVLCTNESLRLREDSSNDSVFRRMILVPFPNVVARAGTVAELDKRILARPGERERVLMWLVQGLRRMASQGWQFSHPELQDAAVHEARLEVNPVAQFLEESCELDWSCWTATQDLWEAFKVWAILQGLGRAWTEISNRTFGKKVKAGVEMLGWGDRVKARKGDGGFMGWRGVYPREP